MIKKSNDGPVRTYNQNIDYTSSSSNWEEVINVTGEGEASLFWDNYSGNKLRVTIDGGTVREINSANTGLISLFLKFKESIKVEWYSGSTNYHCIIFYGVK